MGKPSAPTPPPAPDYVGAANAQGAANLTAGQQTASLSNPNVTNPYGSQTVSYSPTGPNGDMQPNITQTLNPQAQQTLDAQQGVQTGLANLGAQGLQQAQGVLGNQFQYNGPGIQTSLNGQPGLNYGPAAGQYGLAQGFDPSTYGQASGFGAGQGANPNLNLSGIAQQDVNAGTTGQAALMARLQPQIDQSDAALRQQLANQGLTAGGEAYNNAQRVQGQQDNDLKSQAALYGIGLDQSANQQGYNQALQSGQFANQALAQNFGQGASSQQSQNAAIAQNAGLGLQGTQTGNAAINQNYGQGLSAAGLYNQAIGQGYNQNLGAAQFGNTAAAQSLQQQLGLYNQPLNQITALESGSQIQNPQFQQYQGANIQAAPIANATAQQGQYAQNIYGQQVAQYNAGMQGIGSLFGGLAGVTGQNGAGLFGFA